MLKKAQVHMLLTEEDNPTKVSITKMPQTGKLVMHAAGGEFRHYLSMGFKPQHLYFTSDEEVKEGDWYVAFEDNRICRRFKTGIGDLKMANEARVEGKIAKIIATTDPDLRIPEQQDSGNTWWNNIPLIPTDFIEVYVRGQGKITEVMLEYEEVNHVFTNAGSSAELIALEGLHTTVLKWEKLKLRSNGTVIISKVKEKVYTRTEMFESIKQAIIQSKESHSYMDVHELEKWFDKHYPS